MAERKELLQTLEQLVREKPLIGQIYLLLDGKRSQTDIQEGLAEAGVEASIASVSRRMTEMHTDHGLVELVRVGAKGARIFRKHTETETVLNLSKSIREWLEKERKVAPGQTARRRRGRG